MLGSSAWAKAGARDLPTRQDAARRFCPPGSRIGNHGKCSDGSTSCGCCLALNSYFTSRIFQPSSLHMQLTSSEARMQRLKYGTNSTKTSVPLGSSWQLLQKLDAVPFSLCIMRATTLSISSRVLHFVGFFSTATQFSRG